MSTKTIKLSRSYTVHGRSFNAVTLREPVFKELLAIGEPWELVTSASGARVPVEHLDRIEAYVDRLAVDPSADHLNDLALADGLAIKAALGDFFIEARLPPALSTGSSSAPATTPAASPT